MKTKKSLGIAGLLIVLVATAFMSSHGSERASGATATDTCSSVSTTFNATAPTSVTAGQNFTLSGINTSPATSYGFTVTTSTLNLSASGATPGTYSQANTSTNPSPTTGAQTYVAYFPNWSLTATGAVGSQIVIKLVQASATVEGVGVINCPLTATLATINITAPASSSGGGSSTSTPKTTTTPTPTNPTETTTPTQTTTTKSSQVTEDLATQTVPMKVLVTNSRKHPVSGVMVTLDDQLTAKTGADGIASYSDIRKGAHTVSIMLGQQKITKDAQATGNGVLGATITIPRKPNWLLIGVLSGLLVLILVAIGLLARQIYSKQKP